MSLKVFFYSILGIIGILIAAISGFIVPSFVSNQNGLIVIITLITLLSVFINIYVIIKISRLISANNERGFKLINTQLEAYESGENREISPKRFPFTNRETFEKLQEVLANSSENTEKLERDKNNALELMEEIKKELDVQKEATLRVLKEIEEEKEISQARAQELKKFQLAVQEASEHIVITDDQGIILYSNPAGKVILGIDPEEMLGKELISLWSDKQLFETIWSNAFYNKESNIKEITNSRIDGSQYISELNIAPILNDSEEVIFMVLIQRDVTKAKEVDKMKTEFISLASHQLRAPLAAIRWSLESLLDNIGGQLNDNQKNFTQDAYDSTTRMVDLVNGLLNVSRIESGRLVIEPKPTDIRELVEGVIKEVTVLANEKQHTINVNLDEHIPVINLDSKLIRNVYLNFLTNAIKYTRPRGTVTVNIKVDGENLLSEIKDNGYGIPQEEQSMLFNKFFRASNARSLETEGTGLGLYLVKSIINSSNGSIWFESTTEGTTFWFTLPLSGMSAKDGEVSLE